MTKTMSSTNIGTCTLHHGNCFGILPTLNTQADAIISDPPYGITHHTWDTTFSLSHLWHLLDQQTTPTANFILFGCGKFTTNLINSKYPWYRYDLIWHKNNKTGFLNSNKQPMRNHEHILLFGKPQHKNLTTYNPQKTTGSLLPFTRDQHHTHPTQKPLALLEHLILSYTHPGDLIIDPFMGSGTTGVACTLHNRHFIGIEQETTYYNTAIKRIKETQAG